MTATGPRSGRRRGTDGSASATSLETEQVNKNAISVEDAERGASTSGTLFEADALTPPSALTPSRSTDRDAEKQHIYVEWAPDDTENPFNWPRRRKYTISAVTIVMTLFVASSSVCFTWIVDDLMAEFGVSRLLALVGQVLFTVGFAAGPMALAPVSEVYGRNCVYFSTYGLFGLLFIPMALSPSFAGLLILRFLSGVFSSTGSTMVGGTLSDIFVAEERGGPMALFSSVTLYGTCFGSIVSAYTSVNPRLGWRWVFWLQLILNAVLFLVLCVVLKETRGSVLLSRRAARLRRETGDARYVARADLERASLTVLVKQSLTRPFRFLLTEPTIIAFSLWVSFCWGVLYLFLVAIPIVFGGVYGYDKATSSLGFLAMAVGATVGVIATPFLDRLYVNSATASPKAHGRPRPEARLYGSMVGSVLFSVGMFLFGWLAYPGIHWVGVCVGIALASFGIFTIYLAVFNYLADNYGAFASSALAAQSFMRNMFASFFPLFSHQMYDGLGIHWASSLLGFVGFALTAVPYVLFFHGPRIRQASRFALSDE